MKYVKLLVVACAAVGTVPSLAQAQPISKSKAQAASTCYYAYSYRINQTMYDVYDCYDNGDGSY